jgi:hypothetical protein
MVRLADQVLISPGPGLTAPPTQSSPVPASREHRPPNLVGERGKMGRGEWDWPSDMRKAPEQLPCHDRHPRGRGWHCAPENATSGRSRRCHSTLGRRLDTRKPPPAERWIPAATFTGGDTGLQGSTGFCNLRDTPPVLFISGAVPGFKDLMTLQCSWRPLCRHLCRLQWLIHHLKACAFLGLPRTTWDSLHSVPD